MSNLLLLNNELTASIDVAFFLSTCSMSWRKEWCNGNCDSPLWNKYILLSTAVSIYFQELMILVSFGLKKCWEGDDMHINELWKPLRVISHRISIRVQQREGYFEQRRSVVKSTKEDLGHICIVMFSNVFVHVKENSLGTEKFFNPSIFHIVQMTRAFHPIWTYLQSRYAFYVIVHTDKNLCI